MFGLLALILFMSRMNDTSFPNTRYNKFMLTPVIQYIELQKFPIQSWSHTGGLSKLLYQTK